MSLALQKQVEKLQAENEALAVQFEQLSKQLESWTDFPRRLRELEQGLERFEQLKEMIREDVKQALGASQREPLDPRKAPFPRTLRALGIQPPAPPAKAGKG